MGRRGRRPLPSLIYFVCEITAILITIYLLFYNQVSTILVGDGALDVPIQRQTNFFKHTDKSQLISLHFQQQLIILTINHFIQLGEGIGQSADAVD